MIIGFLKEYKSHFLKKKTTTICVLFLFNSILLCYIAHHFQEYVIEQIQSTILSKGTVMSGKNMKNWQGSYKFFRRILCRLSRKKQPDIYCSHQAFPYTNIIVFKCFLDLVLKDNCSVWLITYFQFYTTKYEIWTYKCH